MNIEKEKIDIVYTWVDGSDKKWLEKKQYWAEKEGNQIESTKTCRFRDNDELKYSLRSLEKYANWINKIYIVTDNQIPKWLDTTNPRVKIIDHKEIIPEEYLPTFNSCAIEHSISNIPNLSEYFLYANDDCFFGNYVTKHFFYTKNCFPIFRYTIPYDTDSGNIYCKLLYNSEQIIKNDFGYYNGQYPHHNITSYRKSDIFACKNLYKNEVHKTQACRFKKESNIIMVLYANYAIAIKHGYYKDITKEWPQYSFYKYIPFMRKIIRMLNKKYSKETIYIDCNEQDYKTLLEEHGSKLFCINDNEHTTKDDKQRMHDFLEELFPDKSSFEI